MIHPEANFSIRGPVELKNYMLPKCNGEIGVPNPKDRHSNSKREKVESKGVINPKQVQIAAEDSVRFLRLEHNSPWLIAPPSVLPAMALPSVSFSLLLEV